MTATLLINLLLLGSMVTVLIGIIFIRNLFAVAMLTGVYSLLAACFFVLLDAVDVAFTEAAVGAGISTVLMVGAISLTSREEKASGHHPLIGLAVVITAGGILFYGTLDLPHFAAANSPATNDIYQEYTAGSVDKLHIPNMVTSVLASYRGYDTLGEVAVIYTAGVGVIMLLGSGVRRRMASRLPGARNVRSDGGNGDGQ